MKNRNYLIIAVVLLFTAMLVASITMPVAQASPTNAPAAAVTPISVTRPVSTRSNLAFNPFSGTVLTTDTEATCVDIGDYNLADVMYQIDQGTTNTITLTPRWSNDGTMVALGAVMLSANAADATDMVQIPLFGRYMCLFADVANTNAVTVTVQVLAK